MRVPVKQRRGRLSEHVPVVSARIDEHAQKYSLQPALRQHDECVHACVCVCVHVSECTCVVWCYIHTFTSSHHIYHLLLAVS